MPQTEGCYGFKHQHAIPYRLRLTLRQLLRHYRHANSLNITAQANSPFYHQFQTSTGKGQREEVYSDLECTYLFRLKESRFWACPLSNFSKSTTFRKLDLFPFSSKMEGTPTLLGPLERANLSHWTSDICPSYLNNLKRSILCLWVLYVSHYKQRLFP
jgi:hypothetical protein